MTKKERDEAYVAAARRYYATDDATVLIPNLPEVMEIPEEGGAWVAAWLWVKPLEEKRLGVKPLEEKRLWVKPQR